LALELLGAFDQRQTDLAQFDRTTRQDRAFAEDSRLRILHVQPLLYREAYKVGPPADVLF
jgi:hypothetical protein